MNENDLLAAILGQTKLVAEGQRGGSQKWGSGQTLFDGANLYYSDGTTFVDSSGNVTLLAGTIDGMIIGGNTPEMASFTQVISNVLSANSGSGLTLEAGAASAYVIIQDGLIRPNTSGSFSFGTSGNTFGPAFFTVLFSGDSSAPSTPTGGFVLYSISGQPHTKDVNAVDINISLCPQPDTGWTANSDAGNKALAIASSMTRQSYQASLNVLAAGVGDDLYTIGEKLKALETALSSNPSLYPNA